MTEQKSPRSKVLAPRSLNYAYYYKSDTNKPTQKALKPNTPKPPQPRSSSAKKSHSILIAIVLVILFGGLFLFGGTSKSTDSTQKMIKTAGGTVKVDTTNPSDLDVVVNKSHPILPLTYAPKDLVDAPIPTRADITDGEKMVSSRIVPAISKLVKDASAQDIHLELESGYRSYSFQVNLYSYYVSVQGQADADEQSARPGYSEHQTGLAVDLGSSTDTSCNVKTCFATTPEGIWIAANAYKYGFIVRYTAGDQAITGYEPEAWHLRYVGSTISNEMHKKNIPTLEQLFNVSGGTVYKS